MNYAGKFDATLPSEGPATHSHAYVNIDSSQTHAPADAVIVPDAQLLFHADYTRSGTDLVLTRDDQSFVLHDYFQGEKRAPIASRDGAHLTSDIVKALVGEVHVAQAGNNPAASQVIGHVTKLQGGATVIRNGVSIILNMGDNVEKGDVVQSAANSTVGITFIDGTVFGLSSNARMVLNEMVYDPNGSNNSSLLSLVAGTITFVAGETAKHGDMKIDTPVATMGIRGTAVLVEIDFSTPGQGGAPNASFQVLVEPDGTTGSYILFDKTTLQPIAIVNQAGQQLNINNGIISQTTTPLSPEIQKLITDVFQQKFTDNTNSNTKTNFAFTDSIVPVSHGLVFKLADGTTATQILVNVGAGSPNTTPGLLGNPVNHVPGTLTLQSLGLTGTVQTGFLTAELAGKTGDVFDLAHVGGTFHFQDVNVGDRPFVTADFTSVAYTNANGTFTIANGQASAPGLSALQFTDIATTAIKLFLVPGANNANNGDVTWVYALRDNAFDFLAAGETLTFTYRVTVNSNFLPAPETQGLDVTITITGANDKPVITTGTQEIDFKAGTTTPGGDLPTQDPTSGTLAFADVDLTDKHTVSTKLTGAVMSNGGTIPPLPESLFETALTASIGTDSTGTGNGVINWHLADLPVYVADFIPKGQKVTLTYTVTVTDAHGATSEQTITVVIGGENDAAEVWIHTTTDGHDNLWTTGQNWETGTAPVATDDVIIITDQLHPNTPAYPVLIDGETAAVAKSVTMNDFQEHSEDSAHVPPELDVACGASLTIGAGGLSVAADAIVNNKGAVTIGGKAEFVDDSVLKNYGTLTLQQGGDFKDSASIANYTSGTIEVAGGTLNVGVDVANSGHITVDAGATMTVNDAAINGGTVTVAGLPVVHLDMGMGSSGGDDSTLILVDSGGGVPTIIGDGALDLQGTSSLENGALDNTGQVNVSGTVSFDNETVNNLGGTITITGTLTLDDGTTIFDGDLVNSGLLKVETVDGAALDGVAVDNANGTIAVDDETSPDIVTLSLDDGTTINSGNLSIGDVGVLEVSGDGATLDGVSVDNSGIVQVDGGSKLTLTSTTIASGTVTNNGETDLTGTAVLKRGTLNNSGQIKVSGLGNSFDAETVTNNLILISIAGELLLESGTSIYGGTLTNAGLVHIEASGATLDGVTVNNTGTIQVDANGPPTLPPVTLTLDDGVYVTGGQLNVGSIGKLEISSKAGATLSGVTVGVDSAGVVQVDAGSKLTLSDTAISGGTINDGGTIDVTHDSTIGGGATLNNGAVTVEAAAKLTLDGVTVSGTTITDGGTIELDDTVKLTGGATIQGPSGDEAGAIANYGTLEVAGNATLLDIALINGGGVEVDGGQTLHFENSTLLGGTLAIIGTLDSTGDSSILAAITNDGIIEVQNGILTLAGSISGTGAVVIDADATLAIAGIDTQTIQFAGGDAELKLLTSSLSATIKGFSASDKIDLSSIHYDLATTTATFDATTGLLAITDSLGDVVDLHLSGNFTDLYFAGSNDGHGGTLITLKSGDDAPVIATADRAETTTVTEASLVTGSPQSNPTPPAGGTIHFTDVDLTDRPTATISGQTVTWTDAQGHLMSLNSTQVVEFEHAFAISQSGNNSGTIGWTYSIIDSYLDFLGTGQTLTVTSNIKLDDHHAGGTDTAQVTVTILGSNDVPSIVSETNPALQTVILSETPIVLAPGGTTNALGLHTESFDSIPTGSTFNNGSGHGNFYSDDLDAIFSASGRAGVVQGSASGVTAAPFVGPLPGHVDTTHYLSIGGGASETITFDDDQNAFGLYWGSVDTANSISFYEGTKLVATYTGAAIAPLLASGGQSSFSSNGYVEFKDLAPFDKVVLASTANAFEVDNISAGYIGDHHIQLANPVGGTLTVSDADVGDNLTATVTANGVASYNGSTNLPAGLDVSSLIDSHAITFDSATSNGGTETLHWTYNPANPNFDFLEPGDSLSLTFNAQVTDGHVTTGSQALTVNIVGTGASTVQGTDSNDVFVNVGGGVTIFGHNGSDTFQFKPGFGNATIGDFNVNSDLINIDKSLFANIQAILDSAHTAANGLDTVIADAAHDQITLKGVTVDHLKAQDFHLV